MTTDHAPAGTPDHAVASTERAVGHVLAGTPLATAASATGIEPAQLAAAVQVYQQAGRQALNQRQDSGWWQVYLRFDDWNHAEHTAAEHLAPLLHHAETTGAVNGWWFMRKHPCWRLRLRPTAAGTTRTTLGAALDDLATDGHITAWWPGHYEAETAAFGGTVGMDLAHELFCADSRAILTLPTRDNTHGLGRRELSVLLVTILARAAGLEWYEHGDLWHRIAHERPLPADIPATKLEAMSADLTQLLRADTSPNGTLLGTDGPLAYATEWADAFRVAGQALATAARAGTLQRGLRDVLSYHVIFHWNRLGLATRTQSILAHATHTAILTPPTGGTSPRAPQARPTAPRVRLAPAARVDIDRALTRFPLIVHGRRRCGDLPTRVSEVDNLARSCHDPPEPHTRIDRACSAHNLAALIAADCGRPDLAAQWCHRQFQIFDAARPLTGRTAIAALQPLINLARLTHRAGDPTGAFQTLCAINQAIHHGGSATIHDTTITLDRLTTTDSDHATLGAWLRTVLRHDGTRALAAAGQWAQAASHAQQYDDTDTRLREARQTRVIAHALNTHTDTALDLITTSTTTEPWEHAVAACLRTYTHLTAERLDPDDLAALHTAIRHTHQPAQPNTTLGHIRLGLTAADLAAAIHPDHATPLHTHLIEQAETSGDAFVARDLLNHPGCRAQLTPHQTKNLADVLHHAGLDTGSIPEPLLDELWAAVHTAETVLTQTLTPTTWASAASHPTAPPRTSHPPE